MVLLSTTALSVGYKKGHSVATILSRLNLNLKCGTLVALVGANGIGKSTLLRTITGDQPALSGSILIDGTPIHEIGRKRMSLLMSIVTTERTHTGGLTVWELVSLGRQPYTGLLGILDRNDRRVIDDAMKAVGISHKARCYVAELSDGERQKVMIAKALAQETPIIILDEPTAFLDVESRMETMLLLHRLAHDRNKAVLLSSHDLSQSMMLADELWLVTHDRKVLTGSTEDLALSGAMDRIFSSESVRFDLLQGDFCINIAPRKRVNLICEDKTLRRWIVNAMSRNDYAVDEEGTSAVTIDATSRYGTISIVVGAKTYTVHTISQLISYLTQLEVV